MISPRILLLAPFVECKLESEKLVLDTPDTCLRISGVTPETLAELSKLEYGVLETNLELSSELSHVLLEHHVATAINSSPKTADDFLAEFFQACDLWAADIFAAPFWDCFHAGACSELQVLTFLAQLYHRTVGADLHNLAAVERCTVPSLRPLLQLHYEEEHDHGRMIAEGLLKCGPTAIDLVHRAPLGPTTDLINFMIRQSEDSVGYVGCYGIFHAPSTVRSEQELVDQFVHFARMYPFAEPGFEAVCRHSRLDFGLEHNHIALEQWVRHTGPPSSSRILSAIRGARGAALSFRAIFDALHLL